MKGATITSKNLDLEGQGQPLKGFKKKSDTF